MPIYEYRCNDCGHKTEVLQKITEAPITDCPECNRPTMVKLVSAAGFQLKGTGWYATDFRNGSGTKPKVVNGKSDATGSQAETADAKTTAEATPSAKSTADATPSASGSAPAGCGSGGCACH